MTAKINQKEYLKKYLSSNADGKDKKKKKKKKHSIKIIDDDFNLSKLDQDDDNVLALFDTNEDAPQIVGVIDDRPPQLIANDLKNNDKWKAIGNSENDNDKTLNNLQSTIEIQRKNSKQNSNSINRKPLKQKKDDDLSPERLNSNRQKTKSDVYEHIKLKREPITPDMSPPRKTTYIKLENSSSPRIRRHGSNNSPSRYRSRRNSNNSPPRRSRRDSDNSPPRRSKRDSDSSPARRRPRKDTDNSPPRRSRRDSDSSPGRRRPRKDTDNSPPRRSRRDSDSSPAPYRANRNTDNSTRRFQQNEPSSPPPSHSKWNLKNQSLNHKNSNNSPTPTSNNKMLKTLDGKMAGLQNAKSLHIENTEFRKRENEAFQRMSDETSGRNADVIVRDRSTGKIKDFAKEAERERQKLEKEQEKKAIYDRWGAGLKQVEDYQNRKQDEIHEMNKPLARYSNDKDLDEMLKAQERDGDPMLEYLRRKEKDSNSKRPSKPVYQGTYPENRFGIKPGYRWDGVDRSNGYETKWFDVQSKKKATEEEAYRYSTEDM